MFGQLIATLKKSPKTIVFTEGTDPRILEASARLLSGNFLKPVLVGNPEEIAAAAEDAGFNIRGAEIADPANYPEMDAMVEQMVELRKGKMTPEQCRDALKKGNYFGTMLVKMGVADCLLGGATYSTADTVRPALQLIKTKPGSNIVSSCFIMVRPAASGENEVLAMADCAINIKPTEDELVEICRETVECAKIFGVDPKVAFLSYSTLGSGKGEDVDKMRNACEKAKAEMPNTPIGGEFQFDAAVSPVVQDQAYLRRRRRPRQHFHLPRHQRGQHRLQDCPASRQLRRLRPHPARPERPHQRPLPRLQRAGGLFDGHYHRRSGISPRAIGSTGAPPTAERRGSAVNQIEHTADKAQPCAAIRWPLSPPLWRKRNKTAQQRGAPSGAPLFLIICGFCHSSAD